MRETQGSATEKFNLVRDGLKLEDIKTLGKGLIVKLSGITTPEDASSLTDFLLGIRREDLPPFAKGYYWHDLMGARVVSLYMGREIMLGTIVNMQRFPANDNMVVKNEEGKYYYIPFIRPDYVKEIQLASPLVPPIIKVNWDPDF